MLLFFFPQQVARTEQVQNCLNPKFAKKFVIDYYFEMVQKLIFAIYDIDNKTVDLSDDDFLGQLEITLGQVGHDQRWKVTKYKYIVTVLLLISRVSVVYLIISLSDDFLLLLRTYVQKLLTLEKMSHFCVKKKIQILFKVTHCAVV